MQHCRALSEPILRERGQNADLVRHRHYVLIAIIEKGLQLGASLYTCLQIHSVSTFENTDFMRLAANYLKPPPALPHLTGH